MADRRRYRRHRRRPKAPEKVDSGWSGCRPIVDRERGTETAVRRWGLEGEKSKIGG